MVKFRVKNLLPVFIFIGGGIAVYVIYTLKRKRKRYDSGHEEIKTTAILEKEFTEKVPCEKKILVLGLNGAGKSSLLQRLSKSDSLTQQTKPTEGFNVICVHTDSSASLNYWEIGGGVEVRAYWNKFLHDTCVLVFVVDSSDQGRLSDAANELYKVASSNTLDGVPVLVVASKQDVTDSVSAEAMDVILDLPKLRKQGHSVEVVAVLMSPEAPFHPSIKDVEDHILRLCSLQPRG